MTFNLKIGDVRTTQQIEQIKRMWMDSYFEMIKYLSEFKNTLIKKKENFSEDKDIDVEAEYQKEYDRIMNKGDNKKILEMGEEFKRFQWKLVDMGGE